MANCRHQPALELPLRVHYSAEAHEDELGSLTPGKFADIVTVPGNPLEDINLMSKVDFALKAGTIYKQNGKEVPFSSSNQ
jgi:hypothetical protein